MPVVNIGENQQLNRVLCDELGLRPEFVAAANLTLKPRDNPRLNVSYYLTNEQGEKISLALKELSIVPKRSNDERESSQENP